MTRAAEPVEASKSPYKKYWRLSIKVASKSSETDRTVAEGLKT